MGLTASVHRKLTRAFIGDNPSMIYLERRHRDQTEEGGFQLSAPSPLPAQRGRLIPPNRMAARRMLPSGDLVNVDYVLVLPMNADVIRNDTFKFDGSSWLVAYVSRGPWSIQAEIVAGG